MQQYKNLFVIGTSHISIESVTAVKEAILKLKPNIVALELDRKRFNSLMYEKKEKMHLRDIKTIGLSGFLFNVAGAWVERKLGKLVGVPPGSEMKEATRTAHKVKADIALVDQDISITLKKLSNRLTLKEKSYFVYELLRCLILRKPDIQFDLKKVPSQIAIHKMTSHVQKHYPSIYLTLIKERNEYMAKALYKLMTLNPDRTILAVVGAGHEREIIQLIKKCRT